MDSRKAIVLTIALLIIGTFSMAQSLEEPTAASTKSISVYPNPAVDYVDVNLDKLSAHKVRMTLYNIIGNKIEVETEVMDEHRVRIRVKDFASGYYLIALRDEETNFKGTYKFLKR